MEKYKTIHENKVMINPPEIETKLAEIEKKMLRQYNRGQNCKITNGIYREILKQKLK